MLSQKWVYILWILKKQRGRNFESCHRERKRTAFRLIHRRDENSREQGRKLRKGMGGTERGLFKAYKMQKKNNQTKNLQREFARKLEAEGKDLKASKMHN